MPSQIQEIGSIELGTENYKLVRVASQDGPSQSWNLAQQPEPPWDTNEPALDSESLDTWHLGALRSRHGIASSHDLTQNLYARYRPSIPASYEYSQNIDARFMGRIVPGPAITSISLPSSDAEPNVMFEALGYLWVASGSHIWRVHPTTDVATLSKTIGGKLVNDGLKWESDTGIFAIISGGSGEELMQQVTAIGSPDTYITGTAKAVRLSAGVDRLFKVNQFSELRDCLTGLNPLDDANWADRVQCGSAYYQDYPRGMVSYDRTVVVGKNDGIFSVNQEGKGVPLIKSMPFDGDLGTAMTTIEPNILIPTKRGLYEYSPGTLESIGLEREPQNESPVRGRFYAFAFDGLWTWGALTTVDVNHTYLMAFRNRRADEPGHGPKVWHTIAYFTGSTRIMHMANTVPPRLYFGFGVNIAYIKLSNGGGAPDPLDTTAGDYPMANAGSIYFAKTNLRDYGDKDWPKLDVVTRNMSASPERSYTINYSVDGGAYSNLDINGTVMKVTTDGRHTYFLPRSVVGRDIQIRADWIGPVNGITPGEIHQIEVYARPRSRKVSVLTFTLHLAEGQRTATAVDHRSATDQLNDLIALSEQASSINMLGPWGDFRGWLTNLKIREVLQEGHAPPEILVDIQAQQREES